MAFPSFWGAGGGRDRRKLWHFLQLWQSVKGMYEGLYDILLLSKNWVKLVPV